VLRAPLGAKRGRNVAHHRYINVTLEIGVGAVVNSPGGAKPPDYQEVVDDLIAKVKAQKPKNKNNTSSDVSEAVQK